MVTSSINGHARCLVVPSSVLVVMPGVWWSCQVFGGHVKCFGGHAKCLAVTSVDRHVKCLVALSSADDQLAWENQVCRDVRHLLCTGECSRRVLQESAPGGNREEPVYLKQCCCLRQTDWEDTGVGTNPEIPGPSWDWSLHKIPSCVTDSVHQGPSTHPQFETVFPGRGSR